MPDRLLAFVVACVIVIVIPGPSVVFAVGRALAAGRRRALCSVLGNALGIGLQVLAVGVGLGAVIERSALAFTVVKFAGAAYLVVLGVGAIRHRHGTAAALATPGAVRALPGWWRSTLDGLVVGLLNPKSALFLVAFLPQFVDPAQPALPQIVVLGVVMTSIGLTFDSAWALGAGTARAWFARSPRRLSVLGGAGGVAMIGLGAGLATTSRAA
ncbi:LysE family translocator [Actinomycetospora straminea]|uniref:LysE family translocator n=1 Tax=Actinomycetospora straminea TaxID=663607 RepID=UPI002366BF3A|nr:LysE family translocator [Actinomycetospora straminea]MDD7934380.1 LysE family translocator [Actinomycetospora straminea]